MIAARRPARADAHALQTFVFFLFLLVSSGASASAASSQLEGRVLDPDGRAVANAEVVASGPVAAPQRARTVASGRFVMAGLPIGPYLVRASAPGLAADPIAVNLTDGTSTTIDVTLRVSALTETLIVSAAQIDQPLSRTPDSVTVISGREIESRQQFTLGAALRSVPGLTVQQSGGPGTLTSLFTRGGESDYTLVLVDGVRANAFGGGMDLSQVPLLNVERIEVVRGPQSALYGSDAIGGVVQIITRSAGQPSAQAQFEGGGRSTKRAAGSTTGEINGIRWQAAGDYFEDAGFTGKTAAGPSTSLGTGEDVSNDDAQEQQVSVGVGWRHTPSGADVQGSVLYVSTDRGSPGPYGSDPAHTFSGIDVVSRGTTNRLGGGVRWIQPWGGAASRVRQRVEFDAADYNLTFTSPFGTSEGGTARAHARVQTDVAATAALGLSAGLEWLGESGTSTYIVAGSRGEVPVERGVLGIFAEGRWNASDRATVTAGVRSERITREALPGDPSAFSPRPDFPRDTVNSVNPKLSAAFLVSGDAPGSGARIPGAPDARSPARWGGRAWTRLRGALGTGIRPPDAFEIAFTDNPALKPERSRSGELGVTQALAGGGVQIDATAFLNHYTDLIVSVGRSFAGLSRYQTDNISNARARGVELSAAFRARGGFDVRGAYTFLDSEILAVSGASTAPSPYAVGDALLRRPRNQGSIDVAWTHVEGGRLEGGGFSPGRVGAFLQLAIRGETLDAEPAFGPSGGLFTNPGYTVTNLGGSWRPLRAVEVVARVLNLFDRDYEEVLGYPAPGRTAYVGARFAVGR